MIRGIYFEDFQGFKGSNSCRLAPITLILGPNASGKSTFARALKLLKLLHSNKYEKNEILVQGSKAESPLAYGWSPTNNESNSFTLGLKLESKDNAVRGVSNTILKMEPYSADFRLMLETSLSEYSISQTVTFHPSQTPSFAGDFKFKIPQNQITDTIFGDLKECIQDALRRFEDFENSPERQPSKSDSVNPPGKPVTITVSQEAIEIQKSMREAAKAFETGLIDWFNESQQIISFVSPPVWEPQFKPALVYAQVLLEYLGSAANMAAPLSEFQKIEFDSKTDEMRVKSWIETETEEEAGEESEKIALDECDQPQTAEDEYMVSPQTMDKIRPLIYREGLLFRYLNAVEYETNPLLAGHPLEYQEWGAKGEELYAFDSASAFHENSEALWQELADAKFIEGLRDVPTRRFGPNPLSAVSAEVLASVNADLARLTDGRYQYLVKQIDALRPERSTTEPLVRDLFTNVEIPFTEAGTGLSQIMPILVDLADPSRAGVTFIEEPELHLHPKLQADLMDSIVNRSISGDESFLPRQFVLETHSESMLLRLQKRIRNGDIPREDVCVLFVEAVNPIYCEDGKGYNRITELNLDHFGDVIDPFPISFVDLRLNDLL